MAGLVVFPVIVFALFCAGFAVLAVIGVTGARPLSLPPLRAAMFSFVCGLAFVLALSQGDVVRGVGLGLSVVMVGSGVGILVALRRRVAVAEPVIDLAAPTAALALDEVFEVQDA